MIQAKPLILFMFAIIMTIVIIIILLIITRLDMPSVAFWLETY